MSGPGPERGEFTVRRQYGLNQEKGGARRFSEVASLFDAEVWLERAGKRVSVSDVAALEALRVKEGDGIALETSGSDAAIAIKVLGRFVEAVHLQEDGGTDAAQPTARASFVLLTEDGIHARPASRLTELASLFDSRVWIESDGRRTDGKSILGVLALGVAKGQTMQLEGQGADAECMIKVLARLIERNFFHGVEAK